MHQRGEYSGEHQIYVGAVMLANAIVEGMGIGDEFTADDKGLLAAAPDMILRSAFARRPDFV